jgi:hypothetical protein
VARKGRAKRKQAIFYHPRLPPVTVIEIGIATETNTAFSINETKTVVLGIAEETNIAQPLAGLRIVTEVDTAFPIVPMRTKAIGLATETNTAFAVGKKKLFTIPDIVTETDFAFSIIPQKTFPGLPPGVPFYEVELTQLTVNGGATIIASVPFDDLQYGFTIDGPNWAEMVIDAWKPEATVANFTEGEREVYIRRDGELVWAGYLWSAEGSTNDMTVRLSCSGWSSMLDHRLIDADKLFTDEEQFDIAWELIDFTQNKTDGDLGFTRGPEPDSGVDRTIKYRYWERRNIGEVIRELAEMNNGFDFDITPNKVFHMYHPRRGVLQGTTLELDVNMNTIQQLRDASEVASEVHGIGGGEGKATCIAVVSDATALADYGLRQTAEEFGDIKHFNTMTQKTTRFLNQRKRSTRQPQVSLAVVGVAPEVGSYSVGDKFPLLADAGYFNISGEFRIAAYEVHLDQSGVEVATLHFDERLAP